MKTGKIKITFALFIAVSILLLIGTDAFGITIAKKTPLTGPDVNKSSIAIFRLNVTNNDPFNYTNYTLEDNYDPTRLNYSNSSIAPTFINYSGGNIRWNFNLNNPGPPLIVQVNFTAINEGNTQNQMTVKNNASVQVANSNISINIIGGPGPEGNGNYTLLWSQAQPAANFTEISLFSFLGAPYVARGPGCGFMDFNQYNNNSMSQPGIGCNDAKNPSQPGSKAFDLGAVWASQNSEYIAWNIIGPFVIENNMSVCGGTPNSSAGYVIEFDADDNKSTGCIGNPESGEGCYPGSDYQIWYFPDTHKSLFAYYNGTRSTADGRPANSGNCTLNPGEVCFVADTSVNVSINVTCNINFGNMSKTGQNGLVIVLNKSYLPANPKLNFETNSFNITVGTPNPIDMLSDNRANKFIFMGPSADAGSCFRYDMTNISACETNTEGFKCRWEQIDPARGFCKPDFNNFNKGVACFTFNNSAECLSSTLGNCQWMNDTFAKQKSSNNLGLCVEQFRPMEFGGSGSCDTTCFDCYTSTQCNNSNANGGSTYGGCQWYNDTFNPQGWCDVKGQKFGCQQTPFDCHSQSECTSGGWQWNSTWNICLKDNTTEICFNGMDDNGNGLADCQDPYCKDTAKFCGANIDTLTGDYKGMNPGEAQMMKLVGMNPNIINLRNDNITDSLSPSNESTELYGFSVVVSNLGLGMGIDMKNGSELKACNGLLENRKYMYMLDNDANISTGCSITLDSVVYNGYEYMVKYGNYIAINTTSNNTKRMYACYNNTWTMKDATVITPSAPPGGQGPGGPGQGSSQPLECGDPMAPPGMAISHAAIVVEKADVGNPKNDMRFMVFVVNGSWDNTSSLLSYDKIEDIYYTPGTIGFQPVDCFKEPTKCGTEFMMIGGGKFMPFEDCIRPDDEDLDGFINCADQDCINAPQCAGQYNTSNDKTSPKVKMSKIDTFEDAAFAMWSTNEPTNASLKLYSNDSSCELLNTTIWDEGMINNPADDFRPWHNIPINNMDLGYNLTSNTTYYYILESTDMAGNPSKSSCLNFTTEASPKNLSVKFDFIPQGDPTSYMGNMTININGQPMTLGNYTDKQNIDNVNITFENPTANSSNNWSIEFVGASLFQDVSFNFSDSFLANDTGEKGQLLGIENGEWLDAAQNLGIDYAILKIPSEGDTLYHCQDDGTSCANVTNYSGVEMLDSGIGFTKWKIPTTLGFSSYSVGSGENATTYNITFANLTASYVTADIDTNKTITMNITNVNNVSRMYNFTVEKPLNTQAWLGGSVQLDEVNMSAGESLIMNLTVNANTSGTYSFNIIARLSSNVTIVLNSSDDLTITLTATAPDTTPPTINIVTPINKTYEYNWTWFTLTSIGSQWCGYSLDGEANITMTDNSGMWSKLSTNMSQGTHSVTYSCNDSAGNTNATEALYFRIDSITPYQIDTCRGLSIENGIYLLTENVSSADTCIDIDNHNITLDCQYYSINFSIQATNQTEVGIYINAANNVTIRNCKIRQGSDLNQSIGIFTDGDNNTITNNIITSRGEGIRLFHSNNNLITNNNITSYNSTIRLYGSSTNNTITNSILKSDGYYPIHIGPESSGQPINNRIYNNLINGSVRPAEFSGGIYSNIWNTTELNGIRIYSAGNTIGGNYYTNSSGTGYSDTCADMNNNGICDTTYGIESGNTDYRPLSSNYISDTTPPIITITSPGNTTYPASVWFNTTLDESGSWCAYSLDTAPNATMSGSGTAWYRQNTSMSAGFHTAAFYCNDTSGNMNSTSRSFTVDTTPVTFSSYAINPSPPNEDQPVQVNVTLSEPATLVTLEWNGTANYTITTNSGLEYYFTILAAPANYTAHDLITYRWYATDTVGNMNVSAQQSFTVANQAPAILTATVNNTAPQTNDIILCNATATDSDAEDVAALIKEYKWYDGVSEIVGQTSQTLALSTSGLDKSNVINCSVRASDIYDNSSWLNSTISAIIQNTAPTAPSLSSPSTGSTTTDNTPTLRWTASTDADSDAITYTAEIANSSAFTTIVQYNSTLTEINYTATTLADGTYNWRAKAITSDANSTYSQNWSLTIDSTLPVITIASPQNTSSASGNVWFNATLNEAGSWCGYSLNNAVNITMNCSSASWYARNTSVADGHHTAIFYCNDSAGNMNTTSVVFTIDAAKPVINIIAPANTTYTSTSRTINITVTDANTDKCWYNYNSTNTTIANCVNATFTALNNQQSTLTIYANDTAGNVNLTEVTFTVDTLPPVITSTSLSNGTYYTTNSVWFNITLNEAGNWAAYSRDGAANITMNGSSTTWYALNSSMTDGLHTAKYYANDSAGNMNTTAPTIYFTVDTVAPIFTAPSPANNSNTSTAITLGAADSTSGLASIKYSVNGSANVTSTTIPLSSLTEGIALTIDIYALDNAGNLNHTIYIYRKDTTAPTITINLPTEDTVETTNSTTLNYSISETPSAVWYTVDDITQSLSTNLSVSTTFEFRNVTGNHVIYLYANDSAGNLGEATAGVKLNTPFNMTSYIDNIEALLDITTTVTGNASGDITSNGTAWLNQTLNMTLNATIAVITFENFPGLDADWQETFSINSTNSSIEDKIKGHGTNTTKMIHIKQLEKFLESGKYNGTVTFEPYNSSAYTDVMYCSDDNGESCTRIGSCTNNSFNGTACYVDRLTNITIHVPHFSTVVLGTDTIPPVISIDEPAATATETNGFNISVNATVTEDTGACNYTINSSSISNIAMTSLSSTKYTAITSTFLPDGDYNITVLCEDANSNSNSTSRLFTVSDTLTPIISGLSASATSGTATITWTTSEKTDAKVNRGTSVSLGTYTNNTENTTSHTVSLSGLTASTTYYYNVTSCDQAGNCNITGPNTFATSASSSSSSSSSSDGSSGGGAAPPAAKKENKTKETRPKEEEKKPEDSGIVTASNRPKLVPGVGLRDNEKLKAAIEKVLAKGKMGGIAKENMLRLSASIADQTDTERTFESTAATSKVTTKMKYNGKNKAKNFIVYEKIPKAFAASADEITVSTSGKVEVVEKDPEYAIVFQELNPGQSIEISYAINRKADASVIDAISSEIYAESIETQAAAKKTPTPSKPETGESGPSAFTVIAIIVLIVIAVSMISKNAKKNDNTNEPQQSAKDPAN